MFLKYITGKMKSDMLLTTLLKTTFYDSLQQLCNNKLTLIHNGEQGKSIAIETKRNF